MTLDAIGGALIGGAISVLASWLMIRNANQEKALQDAEWRGKIDTMVAALWSRVFRNAVVEGMSSGLLEKNSPIRATVHAFAGHLDLVSKLKTFYDAEGCRLSDLELLVTIEERFGKELSDFEAKHRVKNGASLAAACYLVRPEMSLFDHQHFEDLT